MTAPSTLAGWLDWLESRNPAQIVLGLERIAAVWTRVGCAFAIPVITVAGTNGKGSTCAFLESILQSGGYKVGLYTSPHLVRYNERVRVDGIEVSDAELCTAFAAIEAVRGDIALTYFEQGTLAALWLFAQQSLDVLILEVGLGGRLDAVNILDPDCAVITPIDLDHQAWLGNNRESIGHEKAGIIRQGHPVVLSDPNPPASVLAVAHAFAAPVWRLGHEVRVDAMNGDWQCAVGEQIFPALPRPALVGSFQYDNAAAALAALWLLRARLPLPMAAIRAGIAHATLPGRFQILAHTPMRIVDIAHNPHAARSLARQLSDLPPSGRRIAVCALLSDKDAEGIIAALAAGFSEWHVAPLPGPRGGSVDSLTHALAALGITAKIYPNVETAWQEACRSADVADTICAFGSFHTVGTVLQEIRHGE